MPRLARSWAIVVASASWPSMSATGSPGATRSITNTARLSPSRTGSVAASRATMNMSINRLALSPPTVLESQHTIRHQLVPTQIIGRCLQRWAEIGKYECCIVIQSLLDVLVDALAFLTVADEPALLDELVHLRVRVLPAVPGSFGVEHRIHISIRIG